MEVAELNNTKVLQFALEFFIANFDEEDAAALLQKESVTDEEVETIKKLIWTPRNLCYPEEFKIDVFVATIRHSAGASAYVTLSAEDLEDEIFDYVESWWDDEDDLPEEMPENHFQAIKEYFNNVPSESVVADRATIVLSSSGSFSVSK